MKKIYVLFIAFCTTTIVQAQALRMPQTTNGVCNAGRQLGVTNIQIHWGSPGVKGRQGKIFGTSLAPFGTEVLGFGSNVQSPWRAGADECTTMEFSTEVAINGQTLPAGKYAFFMELQENESILIFNKNAKSWGSYFYDKSLDVLRVSTKNQKGLATMQERLQYTFSNQTDEAVEVAMEWENWRIPFIVSVQLKETTLKYLQAEMTGSIGFDPPSLQTAAQWCLDNNVNYNQALNWINSAASPNLGGVQSFNNLSLQSKLMAKTGKQKDADSIWKKAMEVATVIEMHNYGRQLLNEKKLPEALAVFENNYKKSKGAWPTNAGLMRIYSAMGNYKKALEHAKAALVQTPEGQNKTFIENAVKTLGEGKPI